MNPKVTFCVLNLRMGGQVSNLNSLKAPLSEAGISSEFALPPGVPSSSKQDLDEFGRRPFLDRIRRLWKMLRSLPSGPDDILHLVLPTPAFAPLCWLVPTPCRRIILHSEGLPTAFDGGHLPLLRADPIFMLPRLLLNHRILVKAARIVPVTYLVAPAFYKRWLQSAGFRSVAAIPNIAGFEAGDGGELPGELERFMKGGGPTIAYIGHAHPVKGVLDLISAFSIAGVQRPDLKLILALSGDGSGERVLKALDGLGASLRARVHTIGLVPVSSLLECIDLLVLPYRSLASTTLYPSLILEAEAARCPLAVSNLPELADLFDAGPPYLYRFPPNDPSALSKVLAAAVMRPDDLGYPALTTLPPARERVKELACLYLAVHESNGSRLR